jgi:hypothetical protein
MFTPIAVSGVGVTTTETAKPALETLDLAEVDCNASISPPMPMEFSTGWLLSMVWLSKPKR